jgi:hypothetical protein
MKKILVLAVFIGLGGLLFGQAGLDFGLGFQYGTARIFDKGETRRELTEPGALLSVHFSTGTIGAFGRFGALFPSSVTEGGLTLDYGSYDYIIFFHGAIGLSYNLAPNDRFAFVIDVGMSIDDLYYGRSYTETIGISWSIEIENMGYSNTGGAVIPDVKMNETYSDLNFGILGNVAMRFFFTENVFIELGAAATFDFLRFRSFSFTANVGDTNVDNYFPNAKTDPDDPGTIVLEGNGRFSVFKQIAFIPSISVGFRF